MIDLLEENFVNYKEAINCRRDSRLKIRSTNQWTGFYMVMKELNNCLTNAPK